MEYRSHRTGNFWRWLAHSEVIRLTVVYAKNCWISKDAIWGPKEPWIRWGWDPLPEGAIFGGCHVPPTRKHWQSLLQCSQQKDLQLSITACSRRDHSILSNYMTCDAAFCQHSLTTSLKWSGCTILLQIGLGPPIENLWEISCITNSMISLTGTRRTGNSSLRLSDSCWKGCQTLLCFIPLPVESHAQVWSHQSYVTTVLIFFSSRR